MFDGILCILRKETLFLPIYVYCLAKLLLRLKENDPTPKWILYIMLRFVLTIVLTPIVLVILLVFGLLADMVRGLARLYYGKRFVDFSKGADAMYSPDRRDAMGVIPIILYVEGDAAFAQTLSTHLKKRILRLQANHPRLNCVIKRFLGYFFFIEAQGVGLSFVQYLEDYTTLAEYRDVLNRKLYAPLPHGNSFLWDVSIGRMPVEMHGKLCIPLIFRLHHSIGDGITLQTLLITGLTDNGTDVIRALCDDLQVMMKNNTKNHDKERPDLYKMLVNAWNVLLTKDFYLEFDLLHDRDGVNCLHAGVGEDASLVCSAVGGPEFIEKVRNIKNKLKIAFNDVMLGALAASLTEHFTKYEKNPPQSIRTANPYFLKAGSASELFYINKYDEPVTYLGNKFTIAFVQMDIKREYLNDPKEFMLEQNRRMKRVKDSMDLPFGYWMLNQLVSVTPAALARPLQVPYDTTAIVTNVPPAKNMLVAGQNIHHLETTSIHCYNTATTFALYGYKGVVQFSSFINKQSMTPKQQEELCDNFIKCVNHVNAELFGDL